MMPDPEVRPRDNRSVFLCSRSPSGLQPVLKICTTPGLTRFDSTCRDVLTWRSGSRLLSKIGSLVCTEVDALLDCAPTAKVRQVLPGKGLLS